MAQPQPLTLRKALVSVAMVALLAYLLIGVERTFDNRDYDKVDELVSVPGAPWSLQKELLERHPGNAPRCEKELISSFRGLVKLTCFVPGVDAYHFQVDLVRRQIRGEDARSAEVMVAVDRKRRPADAGADAG